MAMSKEIESGFLPDLGNELTGEQLIFECKLYRANEAFTKLVDKTKLGLILQFITNVIQSQE